MAYRDKAFQTAMKMVQTNDHTLKKEFECQFIEHEGKLYAGNHLVLELKGAKRLTNAPFVRETMLKSIEACKATLLHIHVHDFGKGMGVTGLALLAESHMSIHTWPEKKLALIDMFTCGSCQPEAIIPVVQRAFTPRELLQGSWFRGKV
jgi:S-adenosylmethionine decarboxylase